MTKFSDLKVNDVIEVTANGESLEFRLSPAEEYAPEGGGQHTRYVLHPLFFAVRDSMLVLDTPAYGASPMMLALAMSSKPKEGPGLHDTLTFRKFQWRATGAVRHFPIGKNSIDQRLYEADGKPMLAELFTPHRGDASTNYYRLMSLTEGEIKRR